MNQHHWKHKVHHFFRDCQIELKRTTEIGRKMLSASKTSTTLRDAYEELGQILEKEIDKGNTSFTNPKIMDLLAVVKACKNDLEHIEGEMNRIRFDEVQAAGKAPKAKGDVIETEAGPVDPSSNEEK